MYLKTADNDQSSVKLSMTIFKMPHRIRDTIHRAFPLISSRQHLINGGGGGKTGIREETTSTIGSAGIKSQENIDICNSSLSKLWGGGVKI